MEYVCDYIKNIMLVIPEFVSQKNCLIAENNDHLMELTKLLKIAKRKNWTKWIQNSNK